MSKFENLEVDLNHLQNKYEHFDEIESTNDYLMDREVDHGRIVRAEWQTQGKGRKGRKWQSSGKALLFSLALTENLDKLPYYIYTFLAAVSVSKTIENLPKEGKEKVSVKWPNDVLLNRKKICGILLESNFSSAQIQKVVIGIGLNINQSNEFFQKKQLEKGTSLKIQTGKEHNQEELFEELLKIIDKYITLAIEYGPEIIFAKWREYCCSLGEKVTIQTEQDYFEGILEGVSKKGWLLLNVGGEKKKIQAGDVILNRGVNQ